MSTQTKLNTYLRHGLKRVDGWLSPFSAKFIVSLSDLQKSSNLSGSVGEIGVHHGKLFLLLHLGRDADVSSFAIDIFGQQELNVDKSGKGDLQIFTRHLAKWAGGTSQVEIFEKSSFDVTKDEIESRTGQVRLMSVDGGHTIECTLNDLQLADNVLAPHGVVVLDDYFNSFFPDVSVGTNRFFLSSKQLVPFAITQNKVFLSRPDFADFYRRAMTERFSVDYDFLTPMAGSMVALFGIRPGGLKHSVRRLLRRHPRLASKLGVKLDSWRDIRRAQE